MITAALTVPFVVGLALLLLRKRVSGRTAAWLGAVAMAASLVLFALVWEGKDKISGEVDIEWIEPLNARLHVGATSISWPFLLMTAFLGMLCCVWLIADDTAPALVGLVLIISASSLGVFASLDFLLFFVFFELALIPMWFVIAWWGSSDVGSLGHLDDGSGFKNVPADVTARSAATRFLLFTVTGSALLLVGIVLVARDSGSLQFTGIDGGPLVAVALIVLGFAVKTPLVPLHTWLPDAHSKAPTVGSVLLAAVFLKLGTYGLIVTSGLLSDSFADVAPYVAGAGVVGIIWSALACYAQDDLKRLIAYSSIGHMGFVALAISTMSDVGIAAAVFGSVAYVAIGTVVVSVVQRQTTINTVSMLYLIATSLVMILSQFLPLFTALKMALVENYLHGLMKRIVAGDGPTRGVMGYMIALAVAAACWSAIAVWVFARRGTSIARGR